MKKLTLALLILTSSLLAQTFNVSTTPEFRTALTSAASNGEDDTIILADGTYKTTDDGVGTFIFLDNEDYNLTVIGSSSENVILSGDHQNQIFHHQSTLNAPLNLEKLSFVDGNNTNGTGGGVKTTETIQIEDCNFSNNSSSSSGGGFYSTSTVDVLNSTFVNNRSLYQEGGGFYSSLTANVSNSSFLDNNSHYSGGGFYSGRSSKVIKSEFINNNAEMYYGGGFRSSNNPIIEDSIFKNNSAGGNGGSGFCNDNGYFGYGLTTVKNSVFQNNSGYSMYSRSENTTTLVYNSIFIANDIAINAYNITVYNVIFDNNNFSIKSGGENNNVLNSVFINGENNLDGLGNLKFSYINNSVSTGSFIKSNTIYDGFITGFIDETNNNYRLSDFSDLIDAGTTENGGNTFSATDLDGNARIVGGSIDIGPYEFSSTKPTMNSFTYSGIAKELSQLTFSVDYTLAEGRTLSDITYDYTNDGSWSALNTHTFDTAGTYTVNVKVTDSEGEFSTTSTTVTIAVLPFDDMTNEQKLIKAIDPVYYDDVITIIETKVADANTTGYINGASDGWTDATASCKDDPESCDIKSKVVVIPF